MEKVVPSEKKHTQAVLDAAASCILKIGLDKTSMSDVAERAGVSRRTLYRTFASKEELYAALFKSRSLADKFRELQSRVAGLGFEEALLEATKLSIRRIREDPVMMEMMYASGALWFQKQMLDNESPLFRAVIDVQLRFWGDILDRAREQGIINSVLTNAQISEWYSTVQYMMVLRVKGGEAEQEFMLKNFLIPSLVYKRPSQLS
ncbi:MAG: TetR/AcrR family transcriptional regulator [Porticoccaceae bacterium]